MDTTNLHTHGLHVSPFVDDILLHISPIDLDILSALPGRTSQSYPYEFGFHYPGTFWYHAHHHGSTTWQVNLGLHGTILMNPSDTNSSGHHFKIGDYEQDVIMFESLYIVPASVCEVKDKACFFETNQTEYETRFPVGNLSIPRDSLCDIYCQMPPTQRVLSDYEYDLQSDYFDALAQSTNIKDELILSKSNGGLDTLQKFLVNGQFQPVLRDVAKGYYRRLRFVNSLYGWYMQMQLPQECDWPLVATDGVYIVGAPNMNYNLANASHNYKYFLAPGGRVDLLFRCNEIGVYSISSTNTTVQE